MQRVLQTAGIKDLSQLKNWTQPDCQKSSAAVDRSLEVPFIDVQPATLNGLSIDQGGLKVYDEDIQTRKPSSSCPV